MPRALEVRNPTLLSFSFVKIREEASIYKIPCIHGVECHILQNGYNLSYDEAVLEFIPRGSAPTPFKIRFHIFQGARLPFPLMAKIRVESTRLGRVSFGDEYGTCGTSYIRGAKDIEIWSMRSTSNRILWIDFSGGHSKLWAPRLFFPEASSDPRRESSNSLRWEFFTRE